MTQQLLFDDAPLQYAPPRGQLLKWIGNKHRSAAIITAHFPENFAAYYEPFLGAGAVLAAVAPRTGFASDSFAPLMEIWESLREDPEQLKSWYADRWHRMMAGDKVEVYEEIKASYNTVPNGADLLFLCRSCYGGVVRFRKRDGYMSTPCGAHKPMPPRAFSARVDSWHRRVQGTTFSRTGFEEAMAQAAPGDLVYCDPPYTHSQAILYGAQDFSLERLFEIVSQCKARGVFVALSIDGKKRSGNMVCDLPIPEGLFEREIFVPTGRSMLKRFQMNGSSLEGEEVADRLLLTY